jgi:hypothetical protein
MVDENAEEVSIDVAEAQGFCSKRNFLDRLICLVMLSDMLKEYFSATSTVPGSATKKIKAGG